MGTAIKHRVANRVKPSFAIFNIWALWRSAPSVRHFDAQGYRQSARMSKIANDAAVWHRMLYSRTNTATVGIKGLMTKYITWLSASTYVQTV